MYGVVQIVCTTDLLHGLTLRIVWSRRDSGEKLMAIWVSHGPRVIIGVIALSVTILCRWQTTIVPSHCAVAFRDR